MERPTRVLVETSPSSVDETARIVSLDLLRGFVLLGILIMNIQAFAMPGWAYFNPTVWGDLTGANHLVWLLSHLFADQKMMTIFAMLYGAGIVLFTDRATARGRSPVGLHFRRSFWLLVFGAMHAYLIWFADILFTYAVCGLAVVWFRRWSPRRLILLGLIVLSVSSALNIAGGLTMPQWPPEQKAEFVTEGWDPPAERLEANVAAYRGGWRDQMEERVPAARSFQTEALIYWGFWRASGLMLIGMALYKLGVLTARREDRDYWKLIALGAGIGLPVIAFGVHWNFANAWQPTSFFLGTQFNYWGSIAVSLAWVGAVMLVCRRGALTWLTGRLEAVGRTAFSNYILQSVICTAIFYGHGLGLYGRVERTGQIAIVLGVWAFQLLASSAWLRHFRFGPLEWLWRCLTHMRLQPMRR